jgi:hypothetical protein
MRNLGLLYGADQRATIKGYSLVDHRNVQYWNAANHIFGGTYLGIMLPAFVVPLMEEGHDWVWPDNPSDDDLQIIGGHCVVQIAYDMTVPVNDPRGATISTWGQKKRVSQMFLRCVTEEVRAVLGWSQKPDDLAFDMAEFEKDLGLVGSDKVSDHLRYHFNKHYLGA